MEIEIVNWDKFNPRKDQKNYTWLRLENNIGTDPKLFGLTSEQKFIWILLLCEASRNNAARYELNVDWFCHINSVKEKTLIETIEFLISNGRVQSQHMRVQSQHMRVQSQPATNDTNVTNERNDILPDSANAEPRRKFDFESIYKKYPRKEGKSRGMKVCAVQIKTDKEFQLLSKAVDRYTEHVKLNSTDPKFIKHFSSFMASWRDWLDSETGTSIKTNETNWDKIFGEENG